MGISFLISILPGSIQAISQSIFACMDGPMCMIFILAPMYRRATTKGLLIGAASGMVVVMWNIIINIGSGKRDHIIPYLIKRVQEFC
ncbi:hypothetical protein DPMN_125077 [Dreissena polymorpha]|uniref:Uncharacterized protein n=1 Tax=Dreissena polymorpha TaxID=45954 RepID=A0A9D4JWT8_DREPO|nr:hypothetical protein DPMN_125077 [Dreissena polymorpha]